MMFQVVQSTVPYIVFLKIAIGKVDRIYSDKTEKFLGLFCARKNSSRVAQGMVFQLLSAGCHLKIQFACSM